MLRLELWRVDAACGITNILKQSHRFHQPVELITEHYFS
jgi:hypothetical protein